MQPFGEVMSDSALGRETGSGPKGRRKTKKKKGHDPNTRGSHGLKDASIAQEEDLKEARLKNAEMGLKQGESENIGGERIKLGLCQNEREKRLGGG